MRKALALLAIASLLEKPYFTSKEVREMGVHPSVLSHYVNVGRLRRVSRGVYQSVDFQNPKSFRWEDLTEVVHTVKGGVICLISALAVYDLTEEIPRDHWVAIPHTTSTQNREGIKVLRLRNMELGRTEIELEGTSVPIFDRERTLVDAFRLLSREVAIKALKNALAIHGKNRIDLIKLQDYAAELRFDIKPFLMTLAT